MISRSPGTADPPLTPPMSLADDSSPSLNLTDALAAWLDGGGCRIGELWIGREGAGGWEVRHAEDAMLPESSLQTHATPEAARDIARYDASGAYRPLKAAPTLIRGWRMVVPDIASLRTVLDFFYPAALGNWAAFTSGRAAPIPLKQTFARQTGMYRITQLLDEDDCRAVVAATCGYDSCCRRRITWDLSPGVPLGCLPARKTITTAPPEELPILCLEACGVLVAAARAHIKRKRAAAAAPPTPDTAAIL